MPLYNIWIAGISHELIEYMVFKMQYDTSFISNAVFKNYLNYKKKKIIFVTIIVGLFCEQAKCDYNEIYII